MALGMCPAPQQLCMRYLSQMFTVGLCECVNLNGIFVSPNKQLAAERNFDKLYKALKGQLGIWQGRASTLLGRILIVKTFGLSQLLYT